MPIYQYRDTKNGGIVELFRTVERRDCVEAHLKRITVPCRVGYVGALTEPGTAAHDVPKAFRQYELDGADVHKIEKETGFRRDKIRQVWNFLWLLFCAVTLSTNAADITAGYTFTPTDRVTATKLNSQVGDATINTAFATAKSAAQPIDADTFIFYQSSSGAWRKTTLATLYTANTNLIVGQLEATPTTNDFFLFYDASAGTFSKVSLEGILTNLFMLENRQEFTNAPLPETAYILISSNNVRYRVSWSNFFQYWWRDEKFSTNVGSVNPLTNPPIASLHTSPTNADMIRIWDALNQTNKFMTLAGLVTNLPNVGVGKSTNSDSFLVFSRATNAFGNATNVIAQIPLTNFIPQKFVTNGFPVPNAIGGYTNLHGLLGTPNLLSLTLVCTNAELGYSVGDEVTDVRAASQNSVMPGMNATQVWIENTASALAWNVPRRDTAVSTAITKGNWNLKFTAIYFPY